MFTRRRTGTPFDRAINPRALIYKPSISRLSGNVKKNLRVNQKPSSHSQFLGFEGEN